MTTAITLQLDIDADDYILGRVLSVCSRRRCRVRQLHFSEDTGLLKLTIRGSQGQMRQLPHWLARTVHVRVVTDEMVDSMATAVIKG